MAFRSTVRHGSVLLSGVTVNANARIEAVVIVSAKASIDWRADRARHDFPRRRPGGRRSIRRG